MPNSSNTPDTNEFQTLWSGLPGQPGVTPDQVRARADELRARLRRRAIVNAIVIVLGTAFAVISTLLRTRPLRPWEWVALTYLVVFYTAILWLTRASRRRSIPALDGADCVRFYRAMLERQRDVNRGRMLAARLLVPVFALVTMAALGVWADAPDLIVWPFAVGMAAVTAYMWYRGLNRARLFQTHIDVLDRSLS